MWTLDFRGKKVFPGNHTDFFIFVSTGPFFMACRLVIARKGHTKLISLTMPQLHRESR